jgi:hypothetical protein
MSDSRETARHRCDNFSPLEIIVFTVPMSPLETTSTVDVILLGFINQQRSVLITMTSINPFLFYSGVLLQQYVTIRG